MKAFPLFVNLCVSVSVAALAGAQPLTTARDDYPSSPGARGITSADFNRDGWMDFATANGGPNGVSVLLNRGATGGFSASFVPLTGGPFDIASADLNKDSIPDLAIANADANLVNVLFGRAGGGFTVPLNIGAIGNPRGVTIADMNGDGNLDIVYTEYTLQSVQILFGDGAGGFPVRSGSATAGRNPQGIVAADFNLDGRMDLAVACNGAPGLSILFQQPPGTFLRQDIPGHSSLNVLATADFNRDGRLDIAAASTSTSLLAIYINTARFGVLSSVGYGTAPSPRGVAAADVNRDGIPDVAVASRASSTLTVFIGSGRSDGVAAAQMEVAAGTGSRVATIADFDRDGRLDVATGNEFAGTVTVISNTTAFVRAGFAFHRLHIGAVGSTSRGEPSAAVADYDHDGKTDVVTEHEPRGFVTILGNGQAPLTATALTVGHIHAAMVNGDAHPDVLVSDSGVFPGATTIFSFLGDGTGRFPNSAATAASIQVQNFAAADLNRDGQTDVVAFGVVPGDQKTWLAQVLLGLGDGRFSAQPTFAMRGNVSDLAIADVTRDGILDVTFAHEGCCANGAGVAEVFKGDGRGGFSLLQTVTYSQWFTVLGVAVGDVNSDGFPDLVADGYAFPTPNTFALIPGIAVAEGGPQGFGEPQVTTAPTLLPRGIALADTNLDGRLDIVAASGSIFDGSGDGTFHPAADFEFGDDHITIADTNRDGLPDIVHGFTFDSVEVLLNQRQATNTVPVVDAGPDRTFAYDVQFDEEPLQFFAPASDADLHRLRVEWRDADGHLRSTDAELELTGLDPGTYTFIATADDGRGGVASDSMRVTILPMPEVVVHVAQDFASTRGSWEIVSDASAASGLRLHDKSLGAPKVTRPLAQPSSFAVIGFVADPTQTYKLWVRLKADGNTFSNDSLWLQISGAVDGAGRPVGGFGSSSGIEINLEECSGCGVSGWGWRDEAWGQKGAIGALTLRFPQGGVQSLTFQTREDGVSVDQVVLSAQTYRTTRPGAVKNDATILPPTLVWQRF